VRREGVNCQIEKDREEEGLCQQQSNVQQDGNDHAVLTAKIYCTFVCFVELFQSILMYGGQRLKLKDTSREGAVASKTAQFSFPDKHSQEWIKVVGRGDDWLPKKYIKKCSKHFGGHMIRNKRLLLGAFPLLSGCDGTFTLG
jgi:hypothetical protein